MWKLNIVLLSLVLLVSNGSWKSKTITYSFVPDGTLAENGEPSSLFREMDAFHKREEWQGEIRRAFGDWDAACGLKFVEVADSGDPIGVSGRHQGDTRFGDIRIYNIEKFDRVRASAYYPSTFGTRAGDISFKKDFIFNIGANVDIYSIMVHEIGHAIGLEHSNNNYSVMWPNTRVYHWGLYKEDKDRAVGLYGANA